MTQGRRRLGKTKTAMIGKSKSAMTGTRRMIGETTASAMTGAATTAIVKSAHAAETAREATAIAKTVTVAAMTNAGNRTAETTVVAATTSLAHPCPWPIHRMPWVVSRCTLRSAELEADHPMEVPLVAAATHTEEILVKAPAKTMTVVVVMAIVCLTAQCGIPGMPGISISSWSVLAMEGTRGTATTMTDGLQRRATAGVALRLGSWAEAAHLAQIDGSMISGTA
jgi:hypothetical protein